jgi:hypothetical protein
VNIQEDEKTAGIALVVQKLFESNPLGYKSG